ncbi:MAG: transposase [Spirochaetales bacterium]|nr:transposase [Spirochaetales bacterium]
MMRKLRIKRKNAVYHVVARANRGEFILNTSDMKEMFLKILGQAKRKYKFNLKHFCIMSNHIHLMIEPTGDTDLSKLMQWILAVFASRFNRFFGLKGHVWYDRFKSKIIETLIQFIKTFQYISDNPVKAGITVNNKDYDFCGLKYVKCNYSGLVELPDKLIRLLFPEFRQNLLIHS